MVVGVRGGLNSTHVGTRGGLIFQDGVSQQQKTSPLFIPQVHRLHESSRVWGQDDSNMPTIPI